MHLNPESLSFALLTSNLGSIARAANILGMKQATLSRKLTALDRTDVRFVRPNIQIYDAHVVDLYQWVSAQYLVGVKGAETKAKRVKLGSRPNFRAVYAGSPNP